MAWNNLQPNQMVTKSDASESGFTLKPGMVHRSGTDCCTKIFALSTYQLSESAMSEYSNFQLIPKSVWVSETPYIYTTMWVNDPCIQQGVWVKDGKYYNTSTGGGFIEGIYYRYAGQEGPDSNFYWWDSFFFDGLGNTPIFNGEELSGCGGLFLMI